MASGALPSIEGWMGRPLWGRKAAVFPPPDTPLETTKGEACGPLLWKPLRGMRRIFGTKDVGTGVRGGVVAAIQGVLPCGGRGWGGPGSSGAGIGWLRPRGGRGRHAVPRAWPPPTKFRAEIWGVGQGRRALRPAGGRGTRHAGSSCPTGGRRGGPMWASAPTGGCGEPPQENGRLRRAARGGDQRVFTSSESWSA